MPRIKIPEVPSQLGHEGGWEPDNGKQTAQMLRSTLSQIQMHEEELVDEFGLFSLQILPTNRVLLTSHTGQQQVVAYMADPHIDSRLILDDYVPELEDESQG